jgi:phospholipid/cholesterol/gamma-HCH transport system permease protein
MKPSSRQPKNDQTPFAMDDRLRLDQTLSRPTLFLSGQWDQAKGIPDALALAASMPESCKALALNGQHIEHWDTSLAAFVKLLEKALSARGITLEAEELPKGVLRLMSLVRSAKSASAAAKPAASVLEKIGGWGFNFYQRFIAWFWLAGSSFSALLRLFTGRQRVPVKDVLDQLVECGPRALGIVTLLSFLIGAILAFVGVVQLRMFGAELYMADLVGMGMLLEMGALMTGIIMAGRAGASFAAAIGTMQTNEEVDALQTLGFDPVEFLVMPRILALTLMAPILTLYADLMGILGGAAVAWGMLDVSPPSFFAEMAGAIHVSDAVKGLLKAVAFGLVVSFAGCLRGIECGRSAQAVGQATTSAVVTSIVLIVLADAFLTVLYFVYDGMI